VRLTTQVGGKYDALDDSVFRLKHHLESAGIKVTHPLADRIVAVGEGANFAFDPSQQSFYEVESHYYHSIATSDFHTVCNRFVDTVGYVGESGALEICYAMLLSRPIVLLYPPSLKPSIDSDVKRIVDEQASRLLISNLFEHSGPTLVEFIRGSIPRSVIYRLATRDRLVIQRAVRRLFDSLSESPVYPQFRPCGHRSTE